MNMVDALIIAGLKGPLKESDQSNFKTADPDKVPALTIQYEGPVGDFRNSEIVSVRGNQRTYDLYFGYDGLGIA